MLTDGKGCDGGGRAVFGTRVTQGIHAKLWGGRPRGVIPTFLLDVVF